MEKYSNIFGHRKYRAHNILSDFCNKYYDNNVYKILISWEDKIQKYINDELSPFVKLYTKKNCIHRLDVPGLAEQFAGDYFQTEIEPNGKMKWPDYIINIDKYNDVHVDAKCVAYIPRKSNDTDNPLVIYNNGCGQAYLAAKNILEHYQGKHNSFYNSFVLYMYYNENGNIEDVLFMPTIYAIDLKEYNWDDLSTINFSLRAAKNGNITLSLPTFLKKNGMLTLEEKELLVATAAHNYIENNQHEFIDN